jgi:hypothetical protein
VRSHHQHSEVAMDLTMLSTIFLVFVMLILSCIILCIWPLISNMFSEQRTRNALKGLLADLEGRLISDITLPLNSSQTTQIDHIFISTKGIFIIEESIMPVTFMVPSTINHGRWCTATVKLNTGC